MLGSAATGSGKSAAFGLPLVQQLMDLPRGTTRALILAPTRELAAQITAHLTAFAKHTTVKVAAVYGGVGFGPQAAAFKRGTDIIVATPGRLLDHLAQKTASLDNISFLVLDEADRMLDMGFLPTVRRILRVLPSERQTLFFSATIPPEIAKLSGEMLKNPVRVDLAPAKGPAVGITQTVYSVGQMQKNDLLVELLKDNNIFSAIAFTRTKARANRLAAHLLKHNIPSDRIHGDRSQAQRTRALQDFKRGKFRVLVATDIAARGIDIAELGHVVNFDVPMVPEDYVHRVGRTARASATGRRDHVRRGRRREVLRADREDARQTPRPRENAGPAAASRPTPCATSTTFPAPSARGRRATHRPRRAPSPRREFRSLPPSKSGRPR